MSGLSIRNASPEDHQIGAELIYPSMGRFGDAALGFDDHAYTLKILSGFFRLPRNRFSHEVSWIAEIDGLSAGILVAFPGYEYWRRLRVMAAQTFKVYGLKDAIRLILRSFALSQGEETKKDELYISHLATEAKFRRQGIGTALLDHAVGLMENAGLSKCSLIVELDNQGAQALYDKNGFKITQKVSTPQYEEKFHTKGYYRMVRTLIQE